MPERLTERIWTIRRQWLGNLIPLAAAGLAFVVSFPLGLGWQCLFSILIAWVGVSQWGFYENKTIESELRERTGSNGELIGFVFKNPPTALDAHAEVGLMKIDDEFLVVVTEDETHSIHETEVLGVKRQMNIHSLLLLGGWVCLILADGSTFRFESRKYSTMLRSSLRTKQLLAEIKQWQKERAPA